MLTRLSGDPVASLCLDLNFLSGDGSHDARKMTMSDDPVLKTAKRRNGGFGSKRRARRSWRGGTLGHLSFSLVNSHSAKSYYHRFCIFLKPGFRFSLIEQKSQLGRSDSI